MSSRRCERIGDGGLWIAMSCPISHQPSAAHRHLPNSIFKQHARVGLAPFAPNKMCSSLCSSPAWWLWRGVHTRSHLELGRKSPQRQWYFVLRRGRVGRCQACKEQSEFPSHHDTNHTKTPPSRNAKRGFDVWGGKPGDLVCLRLRAVSPGGCPGGARTK